MDMPTIMARYPALASGLFQYQGLMDFPPNPAGDVGIRLASNPEAQRRWPRAYVALVGAEAFMDEAEAWARDVLAHVDGEGLAKETR